jgi:thiol:disulfide interchange protein DsbA
MSRLLRVNKSLWIIAVSLVMLACSDGSQYQKDTHYTAFNDAINDVVVKNTSLNSVKIMEFFTYGCSHCQAFAPEFKKWSNLNSLNVKYVPIVWSDVTDLHARAFFLIRAHKEFDELHGGLFNLVAGFSRTDSIEDQKIELITWLQKQGIQPIDALNAFNSTVFEQELALSVLLAKRFQITGTPTLVVKNTYRINNKAMTRQSELLELAEVLLDE